MSYQVMKKTLGVALAIAVMGFTPMAFGGGRHGFGGGGFGGGHGYYRGGYGVYGGGFGYGGGLYGSGYPYSYGYPGYGYRYPGYGSGYYSGRVYYGRRPHFRSRSGHRAIGRRGYYRGRY